MKQKNKEKDKEQLTKLNKRKKLLNSIKKQC
jgi:hypothetical protein